MPQQPSTGKAGTSQAVLFASLKLYNPLSARPLDVFQRIEGEAVGRRAKEEVGVDVASLSPPSLASYQESNHGDHHQRCACLDLSLVVFAHAPILGQPEEGPFEDPALRPIGRFVSVMVLALSRGPTERAVSAEQVRPSSDGAVRRQCHGVDTPASALPPRHRPTQSSAAIHPVLCALAPGCARSNTAGCCEILPDGRPVLVPTIHPDRAPLVRSHAAAWVPVPPMLARA